MGATELQDISSAIGNACIKKLDWHEAKPIRGKQTNKGYTGVGKRFQRIKMVNPKWSEDNKQTKINHFQKKK